MGVPRGQMINAEDYDGPLTCFELLQPTCDLFQGLWLGSVDGYQSYADSVNALACTAYIGCGPSRFSQIWEGWRRLVTTLGRVFTGLPADQKQAVRMYSQDGRPYSYTLRVDDPQAELDRMLGIPRDRQALLAVFGGKVPTLEDIRARIALVDKAVSHPLPESLEARRGLNSIDYIKGYDGSDPRRLVGLTHTDPGYTSTSLGETVVPTTPHPIRYMVHLDIPKGHPGLWIGPESSHPEQRELLLPRGVSYTFTKAVPHADGTWDLYATVHGYKAVGDP